MLAALHRVQINDNGSFGLRADGSGGTGAVSVGFSDGQASNSNNGVVAVGSNLASAGIVITRSAIVNNATNGLQATASGGVIVVGNSTVQGNGTGVNVSAGGQILTNGNNSLIGNFISNGTFSGPAPLQ